MNIWAGVGIAAASFVIGAFGFPQIVGSIQNRRTMPIWYVTIAIWAVILFVAAFFGFRFLPKYKLFIIAGYAVSFLMTLSAGKIT